MSRFALVPLAVALMSLPLSSGCGHSSAPPELLPAAAGEPSSAQGVHHDAAVIGGDPSPGQAPSWPCWRGPLGRGIATAARLPDEWPHKLDPRWETPLGEGWSSPVVADNRVFITDRTGGEEHLLALDALTGKKLWQTTHPVDFDPHPVGRRHGNGPKSTPAVAAGRVYSLGITGWLQCVDAQTGRVAWSHNLPAEFGRRQPLPLGRALVNGTDNVIVPVAQGVGAPVPLFGYTGSLAIGGDRVVLSVGGQLGGTIMALDAATGKVLWQALDEDVSYSSPVIAEIDGVRQVVVMTGPRVVGLALADGALLWSHPFQIQYNESISTPAVEAGLVLVTGDGHPLTALKITREGDQFNKSVAWENWDLTSYLSSMLAYDGHVYGMSDDGRFACIRLADGKTLWHGGNHGYYCSPLLAGDRLLALNEEGELAVLAAGPAGYRQLGAARVAEAATWTMPALVGHLLFVRSGRGLACFELARRGASAP